LAFSVSRYRLQRRGVDHLIADAEQLEQRGETDSAISVLKNAERSSPENIQIEKLLARQYVLKVHRSQIFRDL
jgi:predicted Zn-dependent protease